MDLPGLISKKRRKYTALLGLTFDGRRVEGVALRRVNGSVQLQQSFSHTLSADPLTATPETLAAEISAQIAAAGIKTRDCVLGLPASWAMTLPVALPDLADADIASFLQIEAERGFHADAASLQIASSRYTLEGNQRHATLIGLQQVQVSRLATLLELAKLRPVSCSLGILALQPPGLDTSQGVLALVVGEHNLELQITCNGGVVALRALEGAIESEGGAKTLHPDVVIRETRITLGQLPAGLRANLRQVRIFGPAELAHELAVALEPRLEPMGLKVERVAAWSATEFGVQAPLQAPVSAAFCLAARHLAGRGIPYEFLPPKVSAWQQLLSRYSSGRYRIITATAAAVLVLAGAAFAFQEWQLSSLRSKWNGMADKYAQIDGLQQQIRQYRPWFDDSFRNLNILKQLTLAFPEDGVVSAKMVEIRDSETVTCSGIARNREALLKIMSRLSAIDTVRDVKLDNSRGENPVQFTFDFHWTEGGRNER